MLIEFGNDLEKIKHDLTRIRRQLEIFMAAIDDLATAVIANTATATAVVTALNNTTTGNPQLQQNIATAAATIAHNTQIMTAALAGSPGTPGLAISSLVPVSDAIGSALVINGAGFGSTQGASTVMFSNSILAAPATVWTPTSITVLVPVGAVTGPVTVTVAGVSADSVSLTIA